MAYRDVVLADSPMLYWRLGEASGTVAQDETANNRDGTYTGTTITLGVSGIVSGDTAISIPDDAGITNSFVASSSLITLNDTFGFECWLKRNTTTFIERGIFTGYEWGEATMDAAGQIYFHSNGIGVMMHSSINITDTNWHHLVITKSGGSRKIYIDGVDRTVLDTNGTLPSGTYTFYIGTSLNPSGGNVYGGFTHDEVAYYPSPLSAGQVSTHYETVFPPPPPSSGIRFYLPSTGAAAVSPAYSAEWDDTANAASRLKMVTTRINSAFATYLSLETGGSTTNARDLLNRQYVSDPIVGDQAISGTLKGQLLMRESVSASNQHPQIIVRVVSNNGSTVRGTLFAGDTRTTLVDEMSAAALTNTRNPAAGISPVTLSSVSAFDGDRIVVEVGSRLLNTSATNFFLEVRYGDNAASDLIEGGTETTDENPWIQFSQIIFFSAQMTERVGMVPI